MKTKATQNEQQHAIEKWLSFCIKIILILMPFHAFLTIVAGQYLGHRSVFQAWKEILILVMSLVCLFAVQKYKLLGQLRRTKFYIIVLLALLAVFVSVFNHVGLSALAFGLKTDFEPLVLFTVAYLVAPFWQNNTRYSFKRIILVPSVLVIGAGLAQAFVVPLSLLERLGYNPTTINPLQLVDPAIHTIRLFSTLSGPNQLGAYLILPICFSLSLLIRRKNLLMLPLLLGLAWLCYHSYSRSSWIGLIIAIFITVSLSLTKKWRVVFLAISSIGILVGGAYVYRIVTSPQNSTIQYLLLHGRVNEDHVEGSDAGRSISQENALRLIKAQPLGYGLGTAGPASQHAGQGLVTENWYLQIAVELGLLGLLLYVAFIFLCIFELWYKLRANIDSHRIALFAAVIGLSVTNLFLHSWADATLSLMIFALLGLELGQKA